MIMMTAEIACMHFQLPSQDDWQRASQIKSGMMLLNVIIAVLRCIKMKAKIPSTSSSAKQDRVLPNIKRFKNVAQPVLMLIPFSYFFVLSTFALFHDCLFGVEEESRFLILISFRWAYIGKSRKSQGTGTCLKDVCLRLCNSHSSNSSILCWLVVVRITKEETCS